MREQHFMNLGSRVAHLDPGEHLITRKEATDLSHGLIACLRHQCNMPQQRSNGIRLGIGLDETGFANLHNVCNTLVLQWHTKGWQCAFAFPRGYLLVMRKVLH